MQSMRKKSKTTSEPPKPCDCSAIIIWILGHLDGLCIQRRRRPGVGTTVGFRRQFFDVQRSPRRSKHSQYKIWGLRFATVKGFKLMGRHFPILSGQKSAQRWNLNIVCEDSSWKTKDSGSSKATCLTIYGFATIEVGFWRSTHKVSYRIQFSPFPGWVGGFENHRCSFTPLGPPAYRLALPSLSAKEVPTRCKLRGGCERRLEGQAVLGVKQKCSISQACCG